MSCNVVGFGWQLNVPISILVRTVIVFIEYKIKSYTDQNIAIVEEPTHNNNSLDIFITWCYH